jgi:ubiquinone/menaquinone biosynthesis C-methylase UbiE
VIINQGGTALDVGCGTGRLLLRYLQEGLDVEGVDTSADMLSICREKAAARGLDAPVLYQQAMQDLDVPGKYRTIYIPCGTFCLLIDRAQAFEALNRFHACLEPEGVLVFNLFWPFGDGEALSKKPLGGWKRWGSLVGSSIA